MTGDDAGPVRPGEFTGDWDASVMRWLVTLARPVYKLWFRSEVRGLDRFPDGGALVVSNHSGGVNPPDEVALAIGFPFGLTATFGENPDVAEVDEHVRAAMQTALSELAAQRRLPIHG